ncbi:hypothetical protein SAMN05444320_11319 [Streptoalloteichus hindustanus]|uniref:Core-binding (CB) domain-containing protein n=1 Tax=Streptoalloteichus hindustanus TaxID=2017 RepID=A0A1M5M8T9_STRHI|nr:hypothetical protein SAMN05444320_11319 [Streptoalloteichus hindustanus]
MTAHPSSPPPVAAELEAARLLLDRMGIAPEDLLAAPRSDREIPTFATYIPIVEKAVSEGTRRVYGSYWNRVPERWGHRRIDEPTPSEIKHLVEQVKLTVVTRRNSRGGRGAAEHLVAALRCVYRHAENDGLITRGQQPGAEGPQASAPALDPPGRGSPRAGRDHPRRRDHRQRPRAGHTVAAAAHRDRLSPRGRARAASPGPRPRTVLDLPAREGRDGAVATGLTHTDGPPATARRTTRRPTERTAPSLHQRATDHHTPLRPPAETDRRTPCPGWPHRASPPTGSVTPP